MTKDSIPKQYSTGWKSESPTALLTWPASKYKVHTLHRKYIMPVNTSYVNSTRILLAEFMYLVFTSTSGESYHR